MIYKVGIITASDKGFSGERKDLSGPAIEEILSKSKAFQVGKYVVLPDEKDQLMNEMCQMADVDNIDLILTTGGTGFSKRDITPEATLAVIERRAAGISEFMRNISFQVTPRAMLSRAEAGIRGNTVIINLPGSPKSIREILENALPSIEHGLDILQGNDSECAR